MLFHIPAFRRAVYKMPSNVLNNDSMNNEDASTTYSVTFALQMVFRNLQYEKSEVNPGDLTRAFGWSSSDSFLQQDVQEMMRVLLDKLEELMKNTPVDGVICHLFQGKLKSFIR